MYSLNLRDYFRCQTFNGFPENDQETMDPFLHGRRCLVFFCSLIYPVTSCVCVCMLEALLRLFCMPVYQRFNDNTLKKIILINFFNRKENNFAVVTLGHRVMKMVCGSSSRVSGFCL